MKSKISITLDDELLEAVDKLAAAAGGRSSVIEEAVRSHIRLLAREQRDARDLAILNRFADELNREAEDVLEHQEFD
jgi:metal-responsive CopG/Arc/MetJ family transcriptional regulator